MALWALGALSAGPSAFLLAGAIPFAPPSHSPTGSVPEAIALGDLDGDGLLDIALANTAAAGEPGGDSVTVLLGREGALPLPAGTYPVGRRPEGIAIALVDGDLTPDIVTANLEGDSVSFLRGRGDGTFEPAVDIPVPGGPRSIVADDFDGDGITDLVTSNFAGNSIAVLLGSAGGLPVPSSTVPVGRGPETIVVARLDDDGFADLVTCDSRDDTLTLLRGAEDGTFTVAGTHAVGDLPRTLLAADLDGDGFDDIVVGKVGDDQVTVERNGGDLTFLRVATLAYSVGGVGLKDPVGLWREDADGDGQPDILVAWAGSATFSVHPAAEEPFLFRAPSAAETRSGPVGVSAADLDGDGDVDAIVTCAGADVVSMYASTLLDADIVVDDGDPGTSSTGLWSASEAPFPFGQGSLFSRNDGEYAWRTAVPSLGEYEVSLWWTVTPARSVAVPVEIAHALGTATLQVDQTRGYGTWQVAGTHFFLDEASVKVRSLSGDRSTSADAIRVRRVGDWPPGGVRWSALPPPEEVDLGEGRILAFRAEVEVLAGVEPQSLTEIALTPIGAGKESVEIAEVSLYVDEDGDGTWSEPDRRIGASGRFASETAPLVFEDLGEELTAGSLRTLLVVCTLGGGTAGGDALGRTGGLGGEASLGGTQHVGRDEVGGNGAFGQPQVAGLFALGGLFLLRRRVPRARRLALLLAILAVGLGGVGPGCGGSGGSGDDGGGGVEEPLGIEVSSASISGTVSQLPSVVEGLPLEGWEF